MPELLVEPEEVPPVVPDVPELLEVPAEPPDEGVLDVEPLVDPMLEFAPEEEDPPLEPG